jgi:hypothetical protein
MGGSLMNGGGTEGHYTQKSMQCKRFFKDPASGPRCYHIVLIIHNIISIAEG